MLTHALMKVKSEGFSSRYAGWEAALGGERNLLNGYLPAYTTQIRIGPIGVEVPLTRKRQPNYEPGLVRSTFFILLHYIHKTKSIEYLLRWLNLMKGVATGKLIEALTGKNRSLKSLTLPEKRH